MVWRPWVIVACLLVAAVVNGMLLAGERIPSPTQGPELVKAEEKLRTLQYLASNRRANFQLMGMTAEMAEATASHVTRFEKQADKFQRMMEEQAPELVDVFCPSERVPQPYAAMRYLVEEENEARYVVDPVTLRRFDVQPWFDASLIPALYDHFERTENRKPDATLMGVSAALVRREVDALDGVAPWSLGTFGTWGFARLAKKDARVQRLVVEYFGLMHFLTELANTQRGICS